MRQLLKTKLVDMDLSVRALNCLKAADVETLGDLVQFNKTDLLKFDAKRQTERRLVQPRESRVRTTWTVGIGRASIALSGRNIQRLCAFGR